MNVNRSSVITWVRLFINVTEQWVSSAALWYFSLDYLQVLGDGEYQLLLSTGNIVLWSNSGNLFDINVTWWIKEGIHVTCAYLILSWKIPSLWLLTWILKVDLSAWLLDYVWDSLLKLSIRFPGTYEILPHN